MSDEVKAPVQWYRCSCGFSGQTYGLRTEVIHWLVTTHLKGQGSDHKMIVKTIAEEVAPVSPSCLWCGAKEGLVRDHENEGWVCQEHARKGLTS